MPGVVVTTAVRTGPSGTTVAPASSFFVVGTAQRGDTTKARLVTSLAEFEANFGGYSAATTLHPHVQTFFEEGGTRAYVTRAVGTGAEVGTRSLNTSGGVAGLVITASSPGAWSGDVQVEVVAGSGGTFIVRIYFQGAVKFSTGAVSTIADAATRINSSAVAALYVTATATQPTAALAVAAAAGLSGGADGSAPTSAQLVTALANFDSALGAGAVAIPGQTNATAYNGLIAHARANNRIALLAPDRASTPTQAGATAADYAAVDGAEHTAFYFPWVTIPGPGGITTPISPESYAAAKRAVAHNQVGSWQAGAGVISAASFVSGIDQPIDKATGDALDEARVNAIRVIQNSVRIYGARSVSSDEANYRYITFRDTLNFIVVEAERSLEDLVFSPIDGRGTVFGRMEARLIGIMEPLRSAGGLYEAFDAEGNQVDPGYSVVVNDALNPAEQLAEGLVRAKVGARVSSVGDRIEVEVLKSNLTSSVV